MRTDAPGAATVPGVLAVLCWREGLVSAGVGAMAEVVVTRLGCCGGPDAALPADDHEPPALKGDRSSLVGEVLHDTLRAAITDPLEDLALPGVEQSCDVHADDSTTSACTTWTSTCDKRRGSCCLIAQRWRALYLIASRALDQPSPRCSD
jgi:hypothetical protein